VRAPSQTIAVDAAILVAAVLGKTAGSVRFASRVASLVTTDRVVVEVARRLQFGLRRPELLAVLDDLVAEMNVVPVEELAPRLADSEFALRHSVPSRNGSTRDAHLLALAWSVDADIWTHDRDFSGTGVATWSTANLLRAVGPSL
jgi:predicted nucleic acid-binding protein